MGTLYERAILNDPEVRLSFSDPLIPIVAPSEVTLELENADGYFDALDLRGELITYSRFDKFTLEQLAELTGLVVGQELRLNDTGGASVHLRTMAHDLAEFQTLLPKLTVAATTFPLADPQQGLGKPIPVAFGNAGSTNKVTDAWELPYVGENIGSNQYDYLVGHGTFTNVEVYRNTVGDTLFTVPGSEYTVNTSAYPGYTVIRFALRQASFGGGMHRIFAAADCTSTTRNFVTALKLLMNDATFGLGLSVNAASFTTEAAVMDAIGGLYCDGVITEQRPALEWLSQLMMVRGIAPTKNTDGEWTVAVDTQASALKGRFGHGRGQQWGNAPDFRGLSTTPTSQAIKSLILDFRKDRWMNRYVLSTTARSVLPIGTTKRVEHDFIRDTTTADKTTCYWANRHIYEDQRIDFTAGQEARRLRPGELIGYTSMRPSFDKIMRVFDLGRRLTTSDIKAVGWDAAIYTYTPATLPAEPAAVTQTDYSRQTPGAATSLSVASSGVESDGQNAFAAFVVLQYTVPVETWAQTIIRCRRNGATNWEIAGGPDIATGAGLQTKITGLITGLSYDYQVSRINAMNPTLAADVTLSNQTAPADTTAPATPGTPTITDQHLKTITFAWTRPADQDIEGYYYDVRTAANGGGSVVKSGIVMGGETVTLTLNTVAYATTRYFRVAGIDYSKNGGSSGNFSASRSFSFAQVVTGDVGNTQIGTAQMIAQAVTTAIRQLVNTYTLNFPGGVGAGLGASQYFNPGTGVINQVSVGFGGSGYGKLNVTYWNASGQLWVELWNYSTTNFSSLNVIIHYW